MSVTGETPGDVEIDAESAPLKDRDSAQVVADLAAAAGKPQTLPVGGYEAIIVPPGGTVAVIDMTAPERTGVPRRQTGSVVVRDAASFVEYVHRHGAEGATQVWADTSTQSLVAVLNGHTESNEPGGTPGWGDHRVTLGLVKTPGWIAWETWNDKMRSQHDFAEFIEQRQVDFRVPTGGEMLDLAQKFEATQSLDFKSGTVLQSGERVLRYEEKVTARGGQGEGTIEVPRKFEIVVQPYFAHPAAGFEAFFRYSLKGGLTLGYVLDRPEDVLAAVFDTVVRDVRDLLDDGPLAGLAVYEGVPAAALRG